MNTLRPIAVAATILLAILASACTPGGGASTAAPVANPSQAAVSPAAPAASGAPAAAPSGATGGYGY
jgi:hypothetical protein